MKNLLTIAITFLSLGAVAQSDYDKGFRNGYPDGYCYADFTCIPPITPITPIPFLGEESTYQAGYNRGFSEGLEDKRRDDMIRKEMYEPNKARRGGNN